MSMQGYFRDEGGVFHPLPAAASRWGPDHLRGPAVTGLLGRAAELAVPDQDRRPARASFELFRPVRMRPLTARATVVRSGGRLSLVDTELVQDDKVVARGHVTFVVESGNPAGRLWEPGPHPQPPAPDLAMDPEGRVYSTGGQWTTTAAEHHNDRAKVVWQEPITVVEGEKPSPFVAVAAASDITSLVVHWGDRGVEFINADASIALSRLPEDGKVGLAVIQRSAHDGISAGSAVLFDRSGAFGTSSVVALANASRAVEPGSVSPPAG